jgi:hypothetical protein
MAIRRQSGKPEVQSNKEIERAITLFDRGLINIKKFLVTVSVRKEEPLQCDDSDEAELFIEVSQLAHVTIVESDAPCMILARGRGRSGPRVQNRLAICTKGEQDYRLVG